MESKNQFTVKNLLSCTSMKSNAKKTKKWNAPPPSIPQKQVEISYLLKPGSSLNDPKPAKTTQNFNDSKLGKSGIFYWLFFKLRAQVPKFLVFWVKKYKLSNLYEILPVPYFEEADFKSDIIFRKF